MKNKLMSEQIKTDTAHNFKKTPAGNIPVDWSWATGKMLFSAIKGRIPTELLPTFKSGYLPYLSNEYLRESKAVFANANGNTVVAEKGDILLLWDGSNAGELFLAKRGILSSTMVVLNIKRPELVVKRYLYYTLKAKESLLKRMTKGTGIPHVDGQFLDALPLAIPPKDEQTKIVEILGEVDLSIEATQHAIKEIQGLKQSLIQGLFKRGLPGKHKKFKQTRIGEIPSEWQVVSLGDVAVNIKDLHQPSSKGSLDYIALEHIEPNTGRVIGSGKSGEALSAKCAFMKGDILFGKLRPYLRKFWVASFDGICSTDILVIRSKEEYLRDFLFFQLQQERLLGLINSLTFGTKMPRVSWRDLAELCIALPPKDELFSIVKMISAVEVRISQEIRKMEALHDTKAALSFHLLTGKIRVNL